MHAAFGNKEVLFSKALERYVEGPGAYTARALDGLTAREVAIAYLHGAVRVANRTDRPGGCPVGHGCLAASPSGRPPVVPD